MYNRDKSILYYSSDTQIDFIRKLGIQHTTFTKHLTKGRYYLGKYLFTRIPALDAANVILTMSELQDLFKKDRASANKVKDTLSNAKSVTLSNSLVTKHFPSYGSAIGYLKNLGYSANSRTLVKRINTIELYYGFKCTQNNSNK
jgi:hypothetical protein